MRRALAISAAAALLLVSACASITEAPAGPYAAGQSQVTLGRTWSDMSSTVPGRAKQLRLLSIDGPLLNRLYIVDGLPVGGQLIRSPSKEQPNPTYRADLSATERMEFVADNVAALGYQRVETARPRPAKLGAADGVRFDLTALTKEGLQIKGSAVAAEVAGKLFLILYLAPSEHYFDANLAEVESIMRSARAPA